LKAALWGKWKVDKTVDTKVVHSESQKADSKVQLTAVLKVAMKVEKMGE
jgi:hypothetical protein